MEKQCNAEVRGGANPRSLPADQAIGLSPGSPHYRAYVGPPDRFDFMSATQFSLMFQCGLREHHSVLDFGAGSLRAGRLLIPYLQPNCYFAIEPNSWLIDDALDRELGRDAVDLKRPQFSDDDNFDCTVFGRKFDFIMMQSIVTHCGVGPFLKLMASAARALEESGLVLFSYCDSPTENCNVSSIWWVYPECVSYSEDQVHQFLDNAGLVGRSIPWFHPGAKWFLAALSRERLPSDGETQFLNGAVLHDPQFASSRILKT